MLPEESVLDQCARGIDLVDDRVGVPIVARCENCHFVVDVCGSQKFMKVGAHVDSLLERTVVATRCLHPYLLVRFIIFVQIGELGELKLVFIAHRMDQSLVKVENEKLVKAFLFELKLNLSGRAD